MQLGFIGWAFVIAAGVAAADVALLVLAPMILRRNSTGTPGLCRLLGLIAAAPSVLGEPGRAFVRLELLRMLNHLGRAEEALVHGGRVLRLKLPASFESEVRFHMADALDTLGRADESRRQRILAHALLEGEDANASSLYQSGRLKEAHGDSAGATECYSKAVQAAHPAEVEIKAKALLNLSVAELLAGKLNDATTHSVMAAELARNPLVRFSALHHASVTYASQGDLERSDQYGVRARDLARERGNPKELANAISHLGSNLCRRGRLAEALDAVEEARKIADVRACHENLYNIHRSAGRFERALEELEIAARTGEDGIARIEAKIQALLDFSAARILVNLNRIDEAAERLDRATRALAGDPKLALWCKAATARIAALRGEREKAHALIAEVAAGQDAYVGDRNTQRLCHGFRAGAWQALGEFDQAREAWEQCLAAADPVDQPGVLYYLGECRLGKGDRAAAIDYYERADALGLETHESNLARRRLAELGK